MNKFTFLVDLPLSADKTSGMTMDIDKIEFNIMTIEKELSIPLIKKFENRDLANIFAVCQFICFLTVTSIGKETFSSMLFIDAKGDEDYAFKFFLEKKVDKEGDENIELRNDFMKAFYESNSNIGVGEGVLVFDSKNAHD